MTIDATFVGAPSLRAAPSVVTISAWGTPAASVVELLGEDGFVLEVMGGSVSVDARRAVERTCSLSLLDHDGTIAESLEVPGRELRVSRGGIALGTFGSLEIDRNTDKTISVSGSDRSAPIAAYAFEDPWDLAGTTNNGQLDNIAAILLNRNPDVLIGFQHKATIPLEAVGALAKPLLLTGDPWVACRRLAAADGYRLFFDAMGVAQVERWADVLSPAVVSYFTGDHASVSSVSVSSSLEGVFNGVVVEHMSAAVVVRTTIWDTAAGSPTAASLIGPRTVTAPPQVGEQSLSQRTPLAQAMLTDARGRHRKAGWVQSVDASLGVNQIVDLSAVCDLSYKVRIESITYPLDAVSLMSVNGGRDKGIGAVEMADIAASLKRTVEGWMTDSDGQGSDGIDGASPGGPGGGAGGGSLPFYGVVESIEGDGTVTCTVDGDAVAGLKFIAEYTPVVGDTVLITDTAT